MKYYVHGCILILALGGVFGFLAPMLISAESNAAVILGMLLILATPPLSYIYVTKTFFTKTKKED